LIATRVAEVVPMCVASPELLRATGCLDHPKQLEGLPTVSFRSRPFFFEEKGKPFQVVVKSALLTNQAQAGIVACEQGIGFGQFLSYQVQNSLCAGRLVRIFDVFEPPKIPVQVVFADARLLSARQRALVDWLKEGLGSALTDDSEAGD
jgi:DNA-binding transcriptional LysR family regulator